jgi:hypothetical protein
VIIDLADELEKSLKIPMMEQSKSKEEVQKILDNSEGITIEELQVINARGLTEELKLKISNKLDWAYRFLSTKLSQSIADRNNMGGEKDPKKDKEINDKNRELKNIIISKCEEIKKAVENYKTQGKLSEGEIDLLTYIQEVYLRAFVETIENLFSTASRDTERIKIFPLEEQEKFFNEIDEL